MRLILLLLLLSLPASGQFILNPYAFGTTVTGPVPSSVAVHRNYVTLIWNGPTTGASTYLSNISFSGSTTGSVAVSSILTGNGTTTWTLILAAEMTIGETVTCTYAGGANLIENGAGTDAAAFAAFPVTNSTSALPTRQFLVEWYDVEQPAGTITSMVGKHKAIALTTTGSPTGGVAAKFGNSISWSGSGQQAATSNAAFNLGSGVTVCGWINMDAVLATTQTVAGKYNASGSDRCYVLNVTAAGLLSMTVNPTGNGTNAIVTGGTTLTRNGSTWYFVVGKYQPSTRVQVYVNGVSDGANTTSIPASLTNFDASFRIAAAENVSNYFDGRMQSVGVYSYALTDAEITALYNAGTGYQYASLP
ncbi:MAG: LamG domain-containing protein [Verrucomicrobiaceae bacterium]|nr:MAG: LamG domain-containing protein [Verrucomicrobiaceae bacterium]